MVYMCIMHTLTYNISIPKRLYALDIGTVIIDYFFLTPCREVRAYAGVHYQQLPQQVRAVGVCQPCDKLLEHTTKYGIGQLLLL